MNEEPCECSNVLTYRNDNAIVMPSCEYYGEKCGKAKADRKTPKKSWVLSMFQALIFVFICVYLTFVNPL
jgi:hypothetical protein